ncbi:MAG: MFS transporter [Bacteroidales bacterium]|nr:MFS transporter [Bacteroidales bacterium]
MTNSTKKESVFLNLIFNIVLPVLIMTKFSSDEYLGPLYGLIVAIAFPIVYGIYDFITRKNVNFVSILGFVSILLTGTFGLFELNAQWFAIKEASVPLIIGVFVLISVNTSYPLVKKLLFNEQILNISLIDSKLLEFNMVETFNRVFNRASYLLSISFFVSAILNYALAKIILVSEPGTEAFTKEIGKMTGLSFPVIAVPSTILMFAVLYYLLNALKKMTKLSFEELLKSK